jgi:hypothetical protein
LETLESGIQANSSIQEPGFSEEMGNLRPDVSSIAQSFAIRFTMLIDIPCPSGRISYGEKILEKVSADKKDKYRRLAQETMNIGAMPVEIILIIQGGP